MKKLLRFSFCSFYQLSDSRIIRLRLDRNIRPVFLLDAKTTKDFLQPCFVARRYLSDYPINLDRIILSVGLSYQLGSDNPISRIILSTWIGLSYLPDSNGSISWGPIKGPFLPQRAKLFPSTFSPLSPTIVDLGKVCPSLDSSYDSCISLRDLREVI